MSIVKTILSSVVIFVLASCGTSTPTATPTPVPPTSAPRITPVPPATSTPSYVRYVSSEPYAYYDFDDSFENVTDPAAYGITSALNTVKVNTTNYNMGHQSIQADGSIGGDQNSLSFDFSIQKILGSSSYDFSNKTIILSVFIPADSPIGEIWFEADKGDKIVQISSAKITQDPQFYYLWTTSLPKGQWVEAVIDLWDTTAQNPPKWPYTWGPNGALTDTEAWDVVTHCETFKIHGMKSTSGGSVSTYFLLDDLRWLDRESIKIDPNADSLRKYAANTHLYVGSFVEYGDLFNVTDAKLSQVLAQEVNLLQPGAALHWYLFEPSEGVFDFKQMDAMVDFATGNHMAVYNYGVWHNQMPEWLKDKSFSELGPILANYIDTVGRRYSGKVAIWNVFNEVVNEAGDGFRNRSPDHQFNDNVYSPWVDGSDTSLIKAALRQARISDPNAILILNDYFDLETGYKKSEFFYAFVSELIAEGVPIDGVGFEMHLFHGYGTTSTLPWETDLPNYLKSMDATVKRYAALGLKVVLGEVEAPIYLKNIDLSTADGQAELKRRIDYAAQIYGGLMQVALDNPNVIAFSTMNFTDRYSWINDKIYGNPRVGFPGMFDQGYQPKPAYDEVLNALMNWK